MSLYENINKRKKDGTSRPKSKSTISPENYKNMQEGFPDKMRYGGEVKKMRYGGEVKKMRKGGEVKNDKSVRGPCS